MSKQAWTRILQVAVTTAALTGCIRVNAPDKPIEINLNVAIRQEVVVRLQQDAQQLIRENPQAFPQAAGKPLMRVALIAGATITAAMAAPAAAQMPQELAAAVRSGQVGERFDGYLGYASATSATVQRQVGAINIRRRSLYTDLARRRGVLPQDVGIATGCELLGRVGVGEAYLLSDQRWRRRTAGQPVTLPDYCR